MQDLRDEISNQRATVETIAAAISRMDAAALAKHLTEDAVLEFPYAPDGIPSRVEGRDEIIRWMGIMPSLFSSFSFRTVATYASPLTGSLIVESKSVGQRRDGSDYSNAYVTLFQFRGREIVLWREYFDPLRL